MPGVNWDPGDQEWYELDPPEVDMYAEAYVRDLQKYSKCPKCGSELVLRNGPYGQFYGCSKFPECRFTCKTSQYTPDSEQTEPSVKYDETHPPPLDRCPFCGDQAVYVIGSPQGQYAWGVECRNCHASLGNKQGRSKCDAAKEWNHRYRPNNHTKTAAPGSPTSCLGYDPPIAINADTDKDVLWQIGDENV